MDGLTAWVLANGYTDEVGSGISSLNPTSTGFELTTIGGTTLSFTIPNMHIHSNLNNILEKFTLDSNGNLLFEEKMVINNPIVNDNKEFTILSSEWVQDSVDADKYTWTKLHSLNTKGIDCTVYNNLDEEETVGIKTPDVNTVILTNLVPFDGRIVINYSTVLSSVGEGTSVSDGTVKMTTSDSTGKYLADLIDNSTVQNVSGKLVIKSIDGLTIGTTELNLLQGMTENVKAKFDSLSNAMRFTGTVGTKALLLAGSGQISGDVKIVLVDETNSGKKITYIYDGTTWVSLGEFNIVIRDFLTDPINLTSEVTGILPTTNLPTTLVQKSTTDTLTNKSLVDSSTKIVDETDNTKIAQFECSGIATGTSRTYSLPNKDGTMALLSDIIPTNDKTTSGYFDISNLRIQWGKVVGSGNGNLTVTLPAPFANNTYTVTANCNDNSTTAVIGITIRSSSKTTTSFTVYRAYANPGAVGSAGEGFDFIAIGLKP